MNERYAIWALADVQPFVTQSDNNCIIRRAMPRILLSWQHNIRKELSFGSKLIPSQIPFSQFDHLRKLRTGLSQMPETERVAFHVILPINWILNRFPRTDSDQRGAAQCTNGGRDTNLIIVNIVCQLYRRGRCLVGALCVFFSQNWWGSKGSRAAVAPTGKAFAVWAAGGWVAKCLFQKGSSLKAGFLLALSL